jgi:alanyl-tRNA synthetase
VTERLYYADSRLRTFEAIVRSCETIDGRMAVVLDRTAFYPTSGGQPFDTGRLGHVDVLDVVDVEATGEVVHVTSGALEVGARVTGEIDWPRRFDHMQQHTGQHVLSAAFERLYGVRTVSFHLGSDVSTIDLSREVTAREIATAEDEANAIVWDDRALEVAVVSAEEAARLPLRKETMRVGPIRIVEIPDFDLSACGGTHVTRTGAVGVIAVSAWERFKGGTRLSFMCGGRALAAHRRGRDIVSAAVRALGVGPSDVVASIERLQADGRERDKQLADVRGRLAGYRAVERVAAAETIGGARVVLSHEPDLDAAALKSLARAIVQAHAGLVVVLVGSGQPAPVVAARSADVAFDAGAFIKAAVAAIGGRGGGRPELAQAGLAGAPDAIVAFARATVA